MRSHHDSCETTTVEPLGFLDVTEEVSSVLSRSGIRDGHVTVFSPDAECALLLNERESGLWQDLRDCLARMQSDEVCDRRAVLGSSSVVMPAVDGRLHLGTWQRLLLVELGRPARRSLDVQIVGE
ncbi:MAG TPA: YjbQ family protein [Actinomycetota bacterium]|jgi:secondary thiamine-phosphate synthase enzyme|nr:YjbQ family protein [Actinomycetota bacterium]